MRHDPAQHEWVQPGDSPEMVAEKRRHIAADQAYAAVVREWFAVGRPADRWRTEFSARAARAYLDALGAMDISG